MRVENLVHLQTIRLLMSILRDHPLVVEHLADAYAQLEMEIEDDMPA